MKIKLIYTGIFVLLFGIVATLLASDISPDMKVLGKWKEVSWKYEKLDSDEGNSHDEAFHITDQLKLEISKDLVIHEAETWEILPEGSVVLHQKDGNTKLLQWRLKGRGHVLKLVGADGLTEHYQIQKLTEDAMEIHFNTDLQARGIIKMIFERAK